jgi:electron transfer flavoprotein alpha subunit
MAVFVYAENINGVYKKAAFEAVSYAKLLQKNWRFSNCNFYQPYRFFRFLYKYGADKVINVKDEGLKNFSAKAYAEAVNQVADGNIIVFLILQMHLL